MKILIVDDSYPLRTSLRLLLESQHGWEVCAEAANGNDAIAAAKALKPDVIVLDLLMPGIDGLSAAQQISHFLPSASILLYTMVAVPQLEIEAKKYGVKRVISKSESEKLIPAIKELLAAPAARHSTNAMPLPSRRRRQAPASPPAEKTGEDSI